MCIHDIEMTNYEVNSQVATIQTKKSLSYYFLTFLDSFYYLSMNTSQYVLGFHGFDFHINGIMTYALICVLSLLSGFLLRVTVMGFFLMAI